MCVCVSGDGMNAYMAYKVTTKVRFISNYFHVSYDVVGIVL